MARQMSLSVEFLATARISSVLLKRPPAALRG